MAAPTKPKRDKQSKMLLAHVTPAEAKAIRVLVNRRKTTISGTIRELLRREIGECAA